MNAIIALCHFCEQHGPRVLFCTQPFHEQEPLQTLICTAASDLDSAASGTSGHPPSSGNRPTRALRSVSMDSVVSSEQAEAQTHERKDRCEGCRSLQSEPGYVSNDTEAKVRYISSQQPHQDELFSIVRQACIRSLSSEVCPGREGPIFFGDSDTRYVLSYTFHLQDTLSRGGRRLYSIIVVMRDKIYLLNSWPFLVKHFKNIVKDLQSKASAVFDIEEAKSPVRSQRLSKERSYTLPTQCRLQRSNPSRVRSLIDMTGDTDLFKSLHLAFTWVLKACSNRLTEKLLEGPPTEDSIVDLEKKDEVVDDFILVNTEKVNQPDGPAAEAVDGLGAAANSCTLTNDSTRESFSYYDCPTFHNLRQLYEESLPVRDNSNADILVALENGCKRQRLGYRKFHQLAHHVIIGNQVIVQSDSYKLTKSIIDCLQILLPKGCCKTIYCSEEYVESWRCNFLGLSKFCSLPEHVEDYVLVHVESPIPSDTVLELSTDVLQGYRIDLHGRTGQSPLDRAPAPKILEKMERAIANLNLNWNVVEQCLVCIKEEWMNKVKVLFTFTKAGGNRSEEDTHKLLQVFGATDEDKRALKFWMTGLSYQYKNHMRHSSKQL